MSTIILASQSPRRAALLREAGYAFSVIPPSVDAEDARRDGESPAAYVVRLAVQKAASIYATCSDTVILGCDTVVVLGDDTILGKPADRDNARAMLHKLSDTTQRVMSGVALCHNNVITTGTVVTTLAMKKLTAAEISDYLDSGLWEGKAGGFGYQDRLGWLTVIEGSESNIVGLPMEWLSDALKSFGLTLQDA